MQSNVLLKDYTTMRLGGPALALATAGTKQEIATFAEQAKSQSIPLFVLGAGSNVIVGDQGFHGLVVLNRIPGFEILTDDSLGTTLKIGGGVNWDQAVKNSVDLGLSGIESLSSIPGYCGAAPVQNIGAYGQELADTLLELEAYDLQTNQFVILKNEDCDFGYRHSIFNSTQKGRYVIVSITLQLAKRTLEPPFYESLQNHLEKTNNTDYSPASIRAAVATIRATKLPDPSVMANTGSFFKNPIIEKWQADELKRQYPDVKLFETENGMFKVSAGWLIEEVGLKGLVMNGMKVYEKNALVLVNDHATSYQELAQIRDYIVETVHNTFRITLTQEPEEIGV